jgi:hypothetical protein
MKESDMALFTNTGLHNTKANYEELIQGFNPNLYNNSINLFQLKREYKMVLNEIKRRN